METKTIFASFQVSELCNQLGITKAYHEVTSAQLEKMKQVITVETIENKIEEDGDIYLLKLEKATYEGKFIAGAFWVNGELHEGMYLNERDYKEILAENF